MKEIINIVLVDDHKAVLDGVASFLQKNKRLDVVGKAPNVDRLLHALKNKDVDLVVMDINMPKMDGIQASKLIKLQYPHLKIIILTAFGNNRISFSKAVRHGVNGYVTKEKDLHNLMKAIFLVYDENEFVTSGVDDEVKKGAVEFTDRELEISQMICDGCTNKQMADMVKVSLRTLERHRNRLFQKVGVESTAVFVRYAMEHKLCR